MRLLCLCVALCWPLAGGAVTPLSPLEAQALQRGLNATADAFILPAYRAQADAAQAMAGALSRHCAGDGGPEPARAAFADTFLSWQRASVIQIGPIAQAEGPMRVQLWPDPKGFSRRAVRAALANPDPAMLAPGGLEGRSIALTSLTALELLLFDDAPLDADACALALAIAAFQADLAAELAAQWAPDGAYRQDFARAAAGDGRYADVDALLRELLAGGVVYVDRLRKFKLLRGLGDAPGQARPARTEARLSGLGLASIEASFRALADLYAVPFGLFDVGPDIGGSMAYLVLGDAAAAVADALAAQPDTLAQIAAQDAEAAAALRRYGDQVLQHEQFLKTGFLGALGLSAGFTAADGD